MTDAIAPVSAVADVLALWELDGWLTPPLRPIVRAPAPVSGRALTVQVTAGASGPGFAGIYDVLSGDLDGRVVVIAGAQGVAGAIFGEILAGAAHGRSAVGVLVDGWVRDRSDMCAIGLPVLAVGERVVGPNGTAQLGDVGVRVVVDHVSIDNDDVVVIDESGCVRIPIDVAEPVLEGARRYAAAESLVAAALAEGEPLTSAYRHKKAVVAELSVSRPDRGR